MQVLMLEIHGVKCNGTFDGSCLSKWKALGMVDEIVITQSNLDDHYKSNK